MKERLERLEKLAAYIRYLILKATTQAGSGHPTSALSATDLMTGLLFGGTFRYDLKHPAYPNNDRLIFSKGHASPLYYALWTAAGAVSEEEMMTYRHFDSPLEGHPTTAFPYVDASTGSLGQGLSIGVGMALSARLDQLPYRTYVLIGDSELAEGSQWEAIQVAAYYELDSLIGILDVNRLGQRGETMYGHDLEAYRSRVESFGWNTCLIDGHDMSRILEACEAAAERRNCPTMIIAETIKGKGVSFLENRNGWHGKTLDDEQLAQALEEIPYPQHPVRGTCAKPEETRPSHRRREPIDPLHYEPGDEVPTRNAYGNALKRIFPAYPEIVSLDGEVCNSTRSKYFRDTYPDRFFEMYVAEQNMVGAAIGLSRRGKSPFVSTFSAFMTRAFDQIRMARYSDANIKFAGSHAGVSIGEDGPSQMGLEDIAMFRTLLDSVVLYPCDAVATERLVELLAGHEGISYLRTTRGATPVIYDTSEQFRIGGCKVLRQDPDDSLTVIAAGITVHEALRAYETMQAHGTTLRVIDLYSIKPLDIDTLVEAARATRAILTVEDHYAEGGIGEAVAQALSKEGTPVYSLAVRRKPRSGTTSELLEYEDISSQAIVQKATEILKSE